MMTHGLFLALDGLDGTGKSTQTHLLASWLRARGRTVTACVDPGGTPVGDRIRQLILRPEQAPTLTCEALLFMASRAQLVGELIAPALAAGGDVVTDRFMLANVVYQGHAGGLDPEELWQIARFSTCGLEPDLTFVLDLPPAAARLRRGRPPDRIESRDAAYHSRVQSGFLAEAKRRPDRIRVIDASGPVESVHQAICSDVARILEEG
jgi:dTMP kinase